MDFSTDVHGTRVAQVLKKRITEGLLTIGSDSFSRRDLAHTDCYTFVAATNLSRIIASVRHNDGRKIENTKDLFHNVPPEALMLPRLGSFSFAVLGAAFEAKGLGGDTPLKNWIKKHHDKDAPVVTFLTMKHREVTHSGEKEERAALKKRKQRRQKTAHEHRVRRHVARTNGETKA